MNSASILPMAQLVDPAANAAGEKPVPGLQANPPLANTDFFATPITVTRLVRSLKIAVVANDAAAFKIILNSQSIKLGDLVPGQSHEFRIGAREGQTVNIQIDGGATIQHFQMDGIYG